MTVQFHVENGNTLIVDINGFMTGKSYKVIERNRRTYPYKQIIHYTTNPTSLPKQQGKDGYSIVIYRNIYDAVGINLESNLIAKDFYLPVNEVVEKKKVSETTKMGVVPEVTVPVNNDDGDIDTGEAGKENAN